MEFEQRKRLVRKTDGEREEKQTIRGKENERLFKEACLLIAVVGSLERRWARQERGARLFGSS
jgi:hypothetical protein